jgi:hypothetical protein
VIIAHAELIFPVKKLRATADDNAVVEAAVAVDPIDAAWDSSAVKGAG